MEQIKTSFSNAAIGSKPEILHTIHLQEKNIAIYQRDISHLQDDLNFCVQENIEFRKSGTIAEIRASLESAIPSCKALITDISDLLELFGQVTKATTLKVILAIVKTNMCRRFHMDINDLRMLCNYVGQGTLWLPEEAINRKALDNFDNNESIVKNTDLIQQVKTGDIVLLKGTMYPKDNTLAAVHKSPAIEANNEIRLLFRIDTNEFLHF